MRLSECFTTLNIGPDSKWDEVRSSYHFLAKKYHPDLHPGKPGVTSHFHRISDAFKTLENRRKLNLSKGAQRKTANIYRSRFAEKHVEIDTNNPQLAKPLGSSPTPLSFTYKNQKSENKKSVKGSGSFLFELEKKLFLLDIRKNIFISKRLPSQSNLVRVKKGGESFQVRIPPGPWTSMFIRVPQKGNKSLFSKKRGDLLLNIQVPNRESLDPAPSVYYYKVRIPENSLGTNKVWTLKSANGPIKFTLPKTAEDGQKFVLKTNQDSKKTSNANHIMTLNLV